MLIASATWGQQPSLNHEQMNAAMERATLVKDRHIDFLLSLPAVQGAGISLAKGSSKRVVIQVFISRSLTSAEKRKFPKSLERIPVQTIVTGAIHTLPDRVRND